MDKQDLINKYLQKDFEVNDAIDLKIEWIAKEQVKVKGKKELQEVEVSKTYSTRAIILEIYDTEFKVKVNNFTQEFPNHIDRDNYTFNVDKKFCILNTDKVGYSPEFAKEIRLNTYRQELTALYYKIEVENRLIEKSDIPEINWNPFFETKEGLVYYQRDFCWTLQDKQLLIESIYNQINIGTFIFRKRDYDWVNKNKDIGACYFDIVDGKQRLNALSEFLQNKFPDLSGHYYSDFSELAKNNFSRFSNLTVGELYEMTTDDEVKEIFLKLNYSGVQMSMEHLQYVKGLKL